MAAYRSHSSKFSGRLEEDGVNKAINDPTPTSGGGPWQSGPRQTPGPVDRQGHSADNASPGGRRTPKIAIALPEEQEDTTGRQHAPFTPRAQKRKIVGFDNSDKNLSRRSLGSCTDRVAEDRVQYGPWKAPDFDLQRRLVERLAPPRPAHLPDPRFNSWVNHFEYYWRIGEDQKPVKRRSARLSSASLSSDNTGSSKENAPVFTSGVDENGRFYRTQYHQLLVKRPKTTPGRLMTGGMDASAVNGGSSSGGSSNGETGHNRHTGAGLGNGSSEDAMVNGSSRGRSDGTLDSSRSLPAISGLDRRYMGLQSVDTHQMKEIVGRLSRMTSAYQAKFAPNPHVWIDNSPGAHMVTTRRENTLA